MSRTQIDGGWFGCYGDLICKFQAVISNYTLWYIIDIIFQYDIIFILTIHFYHFIGETFLA